jgi:hypothetical protein
MAIGALPVIIASFSRKECISQQQDKREERSERGEVRSDGGHS